MVSATAHSGSAPLPAAGTCGMVADCCRPTAGCRPRNRSWAPSPRRPTARTLTGTFGLRGAYSYLTSFGEMVPRFRFEYSHDFQGAGRANLSYVDWIGGPIYGVDVDPLDQNRILGGVGLDVLTLDGSRFSFGYETTVGSGAEQHQIRLRLQTRF